MQTRTFELKIYTSGISKEQAGKEIETEDSKRYEFHKYYTNEIWGMSNGYELCLTKESLESMDVKMIWTI